MPLSIAKLNAILHSPFLNASFSSSKFLLNIDTFNFFISHLYFLLNSEHETTLPALNFALYILPLYSIFPVYIGFDFLLFVLYKFLISAIIGLKISVKFLSIYLLT